MTIKQHERTNRSGIRIAMNTRTFRLKRHVQSVRDAPEDFNHRYRNRTLEENMLRRSKIAGFAILLGLGSSAAHADLFEIGNLTPGRNGWSTGTLGDVAASGDVSFSLTTAGQFDGSSPQDLLFQGVATPAYVGTTSDGSLLLNDLGTFTLWRPTQGADPYQQVTFALDVAFSAPGGVVGNSTFSAVLSGTANTQHGEILIDFGPAHHFTFSNAAGSGAFDLAINDVSLLLPGPHSNIESVSQVLTGTITNAFDPPAQVPEPLSIVLLGSTLLVLVRSIRLRCFSRHQS